jgi:hypothetical protein
VTFSDDIRDEFIAAALVDGGSFADIGGLWGTVSEKVTVAHAAGATSVAMVDILPTSNPLWAAFRERVSYLGVPTWQEHVANLDEAPPTLGPWDVVHCSGVIYHCPNPLHTLRKLHALTGKSLVLTSMVLAERMETDRGVIEVPAGQPIFIPGLDAENLSIVDRFLEMRGVRNAIGIDVPAEYDVTDYGPWWWVPTPSALEAMVRTAGYRILGSGPFWDGRSWTVHARPVR